MSNTLNSKMSDKKRNSKKVKPTQENVGSRIPKSIDYTDHDAKTIRLLCYMTKRSIPYLQHSPEGWLSMPSRDLIKFLGGSYKTSLKDAIKRGYIEPLNDKFGKGIFSKEKGISKKYRFCASYRKEIALGKLSAVSTDMTPDDKAQVAALIGANQLPELLLKFYKNLTIHEDWYTPIDLEKFLSEEGEILLQDDPKCACQFETRCFEITVESTGRLFHPLSVMHQDLRGHLWYCGQMIHYIEIDDGTLYLLAHFMDKAERKNWFKLCAGGFDDRFMTQEQSREQVESAIAEVISYQPAEKTGLAKEIIDCIEEQAPSLFRWLEAQWLKSATSGDEVPSVEFQLQQLEAKLLNTAHQLLCQEFWVLPMRHGLAMESKNQQTAKIRLQQVCKETLGYPLSINYR